MDAVKRFQSLAFGEDKEGRRGKAAFVEKGINELKIAGKNTLFKRPELGRQFDEELAQADRDVKTAEANMTRLDQQIERLQTMRVAQLRTEATLARFIGEGVQGVNRFVGQGAKAAQAHVEKLFGEGAGDTKLRLPFLGELDVGNVKESAAQFGKLFADTIGLAASAPGQLAALGLGAAAGDGRALQPPERGFEFVGLSDFSRKIQEGLTKKSDDPTSPSGGRGLSERMAALLDKIQQHFEKGVTIKKMPPIDMTARAAP